MHFTEYDVRVAAYAVILDDAGRILLTWFNGNARSAPGWSLPGGGVELEESLEEAVVRETHEEAGYHVVVGAPLATSSSTEPGDARRRPHKAGRVLFDATITGGTLGTVEVGGTTDFARWVPVDEVLAGAEPRAGIVDLALAVLGEGRDLPGGS